MKPRAPLVQRRRVVATVLLAAQIAGCSSWRMEQAAPEQVLHQRTPTEVRVTRADGSQLVLAHPSVSGDSLTGFSSGAPRGVPMADIGAIATRHGNAGKSVLLGVGILGGAIAIGAIAYSASSPCYFSCR
jgi:hypothetical protein